MKTKKIILWILTLLPLAVTLAALPFLPDQIPAHYDFNNQVTRWGSKYETLVFPALTLASSLIMLILVKFYSKTEENGTNNVQVCLTAGILSALVFDGMTVYFLYVDFCQLENLTLAPVDINQVVFGLLAVFMIVIGNVMPKVRMNSMLGLRTVWSMKNETTWKKSQRFGGLSFIIGGTAMLLACLFARGLACLMWSTGILMVIVIADVAYSWHVACKF